MKNTALMLAGTVFSLAAVLQLVRYFKAWELIIEQHHIPVEWSLYAGIILGLLAVWMFIAERK